MVPGDTEINSVFFASTRAPVRLSKGPQSKVQKAVWEKLQFSPGPLCGAPDGRNDSVFLSFRIPVTPFCSPLPTDFPLLRTAMAR